MSKLEDLSFEAKISSKVDHLTAANSTVACDSVCYAIRNSACLGYCCSLALLAGGIRLGTASFD